MSSGEPRLLHDFVTWRRDLRSVEDLGAYRTIARNLTLANVRTEPVMLAETTRRRSASPACRPSWAGH